MIKYDKLCDIREVPGVLAGCYSYSYATNGDPTP